MRGGPSHPRLPRRCQPPVLRSSAPLHHAHSPAPYILSLLSQPSGVSGGSGSYQQQRLSCCLPSTRCSSPAATHATSTPSPRRTQHCQPAGQPPRLRHSVSTPCTLRCRQGAGHFLHRACLLLHRPCRLPAGGFHRIASYIQPARCTCYLPLSRMLPCPPPSCTHTPTYAH